MNRKEFLSQSVLPGRCDVELTGELLGFLPHEISVLMAAGLLKPLGRPAPNGHKFFFTSEILELREDRAWLQKATLAVGKHWRERNRKAGEG